MKDRDTLSLIGDRYLDTQFDSEHIVSLEAELRDRGVTGFKRWALEYLAAGGLWWNLLWWEWVDLDGKDIKLGWVQNGFLYLIVGGAVYFLLSSFLVSLGAVLLLHVFTTCIGFELRKGSKLNKIKNENASSAGTDAQKDARPF